MKFFKKALFLLFFLFLSFPAESLRITTHRIAYVDVQEVYENLIIVRQARADMQELINRQRDEVHELQERIEQLRETIEQIESKEEEEVDEIDFPEEPDEIQEPHDPEGEEEELRDLDTPDTPADIRDRQDELEKLLKEKEKTLKELKDTSAEMIREKEESYRRRIMSEIYDSLQEIARREGYSAVLDGEVIFFTGDDVVDITDMVTEELNEKARKN